MTMAAAWRREGRREALCGTLRELLNHRFGPVGSDLDARIRKASEAELMQWIVAATDAVRIEDAFVSAGSN